MNRAIEQALTSLLPRLNTDLPSQLTELTSSLIAQSRLKASNLSQDEEIARTYCCANIACERLKTTLNLPKIEPRPPVAPRVYKKLYGHLDTALVAQRQQRSPKKIQRGDVQELPQPPPKTPTKRKATNPTVASASKKGRQTPSKEASLAQYKKVTTARKSELQHGERGLEIPAWIHPMIRGLCAKLEAKGAAPHVLAGVSSVLTLPTPKLVDGKGTGKERIPALLAAVFILARTRLLGVTTDGKEYVGLRKQILNGIRELRTDKELIKKVSGIQKGKKGWEGYGEVVGKDVDAWLMELSAKGWVELDWFGNIESGAGLGLPEWVDYDNYELQNEEDDEEDEGEETMMGLGTMLQDKVDFLSKRKRDEYKVWKESFMRRLEQAEEAEKKQSTRMEVD